MHILVLDDDDDFASGIAALLVRMGHDAAVAHDCESAKRLASSRPFDVILADVELPDGDGRHVCNGLRMAGASQDAYMIARDGSHRSERSRFSIVRWLCAKAHHIRVA